MLQISFFVETWQQAEEDSIKYKSENRDNSQLYITAYVFIVAAVSLIISDLNYYGGSAASTNLILFLDSPDIKSDHPFLWSIISAIFPFSGNIITSGYYELFELAYWTAVKVFAYLLLPALAVAIHPKLNFKMVGLSFDRDASHLKIYASLFAIVFVIVTALSFTKNFSEYYPFYTQSMRSPLDFWTWELLYAIQFFALEFFFRGFILQLTKKAMGASAIIAMMLPYVMIHFGKPMPECFGAIIAGIILGTLALKTRSIWAGFLLHTSVALSMDVASDIQKGGLNFLKMIFGF
ncbi:MAG: CPBP family intramembrane metalloprotease [Deltaproteobacteria bacterium]|nr:CPBP family intramembrane metalloprotease [Deltaproteobacteria bacterium]